MPEPQRLRRMERVTVCVAVADWIQEHKEIVRRAWAAWQLAHVCAVRGYLEAEVIRLTKRLGRKESESIWDMRKPALVEQVIKRLGWSREQAESETVGQLRLHLKELNQTEKAEKAVLPKGLARMKRDELQDECVARGIETHRADKKAFSREELIRDLKKWAARTMAEAEATADGQSSTTSAAAKARPKVRPNVQSFRPAGRGRRQRDEDEDFAMVDVPSSASD